MKRIWLLTILVTVIAACAKPSDTTSIENEIAAVQRDVSAAEDVLAKLNQGSALWALESLHLEVERQTLSMLKQKRASLLYYVNLDYRVDGTIYYPPSNQAELVTRLEREVVQAAADSQDAAKKAEALGGLVGAMKSLEAMTKALTHAQLRYQLLACKFGFPPYFKPEGAGQLAAAAVQPSAQTPPPSNRPAEIEDPAAGNHDFRVADWGASREDVKARERETLAEDTLAGLYYKTTIASLTATAVYEFDNDKLVQGSYLNTSFHVNKTDYIRDYQALKELLTTKYGKPVEDATIWKNDLYKERPSDWGTAISIGHLVYRARWETERSNITTGLIGDNFNVTHAVWYEEKAGAFERDRQKQKKALGQL